jgi:hypothetical protein
VLAALSFLLISARAAPASADSEEDPYDPDYSPEELAEILANMPDASSNIYDPVLKKEALAKYGGGKLKVSVDSLEPEGGPTTGNTRVLVRGGPFGEGLDSIFPRPRCKFGKHDMIVDATYVLCTTAPTATES